jgi:hypothetical protein
MTNVDVNNNIEMTVILLYYNYSELKIVLLVTYLLLLLIQ